MDTLTHTHTTSLIWEALRLITTVPVQTRIRIRTDIFPTKCPKARADHDQYICLIWTVLWACMVKILFILPTQRGRGHKVIEVKIKASRILELILTPLTILTRTRTPVFRAILLIQCVHSRSRLLLSMVWIQRLELRQLHQLRLGSCQIKTLLHHNLNTQPFYKSNLSSKTSRS